MSLSTILFILSMVALAIGLSLPRLFNNPSKVHQYVSYTIGWSMFGLFWMSRFEYYVFKTRSLVYLLLIPLATSICLILGYTAIKTLRTNKTLHSAYHRATKGAFIASSIYMPFTLIDTLRRVAIESVAFQVFTILQMMGIENVTRGIGPEFGYQSAIIFTQNGHTYLTYIAENCTGIGSMAVVIAIIAITDRTFQQKVGYSVFSLAIVHILNIIRNVAIALGFGHQWFDFLEPTLAPILSYDDPNLVSFFIVDKIFAQVGSAVALLLIFYIFLKYFPELQETVQELYEFTRDVTGI